MPKVIGVVAGAKDATGDPAQENRLVQQWAQAFQTPNFQHGSGDTDFDFKFVYFRAQEPHLRQSGEFTRVIAELLSHDTRLAFSVDSRFVNPPPQFNRPIISFLGTRWAHSDTITGFRTPPYVYGHMKTIARALPERRVAIVHMADNFWEQQEQEIRTLARAAGVDLAERAVEVGGPEGFEPGLEQAKAMADAIYLVPHGIFTLYPRLLADLEAALDVPVFFPHMSHVRNGGSISMCLDPDDLVAPLALYVRRILSDNASPRDLKPQFRRLALAVNVPRAEAFQMDLAAIESDITHSFSVATSG